MFTGRLAPVSNRQTWIEQISIVDDDTGEGIDLTGHTLTVQVRQPGTSTVLLTATIANGAIALIEDESEINSVFQFTFTESQMDDLCAGIYEVGITDLADTGETTQLMIATVQVLDGVVT